ncbi:uncharacterized protein LOC113213968, partial [Frankliniella occidentalis]|uniref:Uncharacterized protein LOC113213968 n=1 Tax=Frankliniella occidentalis TaxID=133901 RepID=A0A6J1TBD5_FRAOC
MDLDLEDAGELLILAGGMLDSDDDDHEINDPVIWFKVTVNVEEYLMMQDAAFRLHFRMSTGIFESLVLVLAEALGENEILRHNEEFPLRHILLSVLWILATPDTFRSVALRFGVTPGVLHHHYKEIITVLSDLSAEIVQWPSAEEREILKEAGEIRTGFPGAVMAIDGSFIPLFYAPHVEPQRFLNRKFDYAVTLQACADINLVFRDIYCGEPGSLHDSRVFRRSPLSRRLLEQNLLADGEHILGDSAYILTDKVLTPFRNIGNLTVQQINYNFRLSSLRSMVERAFGLLKMKWRRLFYLSAKRMDLVVRTVVASITLHNFLIYGGEIPEVDLQHIEPEANF